MSPLEAVVFDVDDTLYLERHYVRSGLAAVDRWLAEHLGRAGFFDRAWEAFDRGVRGNLFDRVLAGWNLPVSAEALARLVQQLVTIYRTHDPAIALAPDAEACLARLHPGFRLAAVSDGPLPSQRAKVRRLGLERWMEPIVLTASLGPGFAKPSTEPFRAVERFLGVSGERCVYVADNPAKDFHGPQALGWQTVRIRRPLGLHAAADCPLRLDMAAEDLGPLVAWLEERP